MMVMHHGDHTITYRRGVYTIADQNGQILDEVREGDLQPGPSDSVVDVACWLSDHCLEGEGE